MAIPIRTIVAGIAELEAEDPVLRYARGLAERLGAVLHLVHAYPLPPEMATVGIGDAALAPPQAAGVTSVELERDLEARLAQLLPEPPVGPPIVPRVLQGPAHAALARVAEEVDADLLLVGAPRHSGLARLVLGDTVGRTLREARAPTLVLRPPLPYSDARVLLTTDLSVVSAVACAAGIEIALELFRPGPIAFRCLYTFMFPLSIPSVLGSDLDVEPAREELRRFVDELPAPDVSVEPTLRIGVPEEKIVAESADWHAHLVVLGTHARRGLTRLVLGSVAEAAVRDVSCSSLVVAARAIGRRFEDRASPSGSGQKGGADL